MANDIQFARELNGKSIVTGIHWLPVNSNKDGKYHYAELIDEAVEEHEISKPLITKLRAYSEVVQVGVCSGKIKEKGVEKKKLYPAASMYCQYQQNYSSQNESSQSQESNVWIALEHFLDGYWCCSIENGTVISEHHGLSKEQAEQEANRTLNLVDSSNMSASLVGGSIHEFDESNQTEITLEFIAEKLTDSDWSQILLCKPNRSYTQIAAFTLLLGLTLYVMNSQFDILTFGKSEAELHQEQIELATNAVETYYDNIKALPPYKTFIEAVSSTFEENNFFDSPWPFVSASCSSAGQCRASFTNSDNDDLSTIKAFLSKRCISVDVNPQGSAANCAFSIGLPPEPQIQSEFGESVFPLTEQLILLTDNDLQTKISNPAASVIPGGELAPIELIHKEGAWTLSGDFLDVVNVVSELHLVGWAKVKSVKIDDSQQALKIKVEGTYVVQK